MPPLSNTKQELFCQALSQGKTNEQAYVQAGYKPNRANASVLKAKQHISNRISELMQRNVEKHDAVVQITTERLVQMAEEARVRAMELGQPAAAVTAITALAKLSGKWIERSEQTNRTADLDQMTDAELEAIIRGDSAPTTDTGRIQPSQPQLKH